MQQGFDPDHNYFDAGYFYQYDHNDFDVPIITMIFGRKSDHSASLSSPHNHNH